MRRKKSRRKNKYNEEGEEKSGREILIMRISMVLMLRTEGDTTE